MDVAHKVQEAEEDALLRAKDLLHIAIFNISYVRGLFPEIYFNDENVPSLEMKIKKLMPVDAESRRLIDWMEKGVYDALQKKYLKTLLFCVCEAIDGPMIEEYAFSFSYSNSDSQEVSMNINRTGNRKGGTFKCKTEITPNQMRSSACKMVRTLIQLMRTLDKMPEERTILMKLLYYDNVTNATDSGADRLSQPSEKSLELIKRSSYLVKEILWKQKDLISQPDDYEPPLFQSCTEEEAHNPWTKTPLKMEVGNVNSKHLILALKVKSVLDSCEDENNDNQGDVGLGGDSAQRYENSESDSDASLLDKDQYRVAPAVKKQCRENSTIADEDIPQDPEADEQQLGRLKDWINSYHHDIIDLAGVLANFPDMSLVLIEDIMDKLVKEGVLSKTGEQSYNVNKHKKLDFEFDAVKGEMGGQIFPNGKQSVGQDQLYMMLQSMLEGEANMTHVHKLIDEITLDSFVESKSNRRLGRGVIQADLTERKPMEVKPALDMDAAHVDLKKERPCQKLRWMEGWNSFRSSAPHWLETESQLVLNFIKKHFGHFEGRYTLGMAAFTAYGLLTFGKPSNLSRENNREISQIKSDLKDIRSSIAAKRGAIEELRRNMTGLARAQTSQSSSKLLDGTASSKPLPSLASSFLKRICRST